jgi:hypothetical protein
MNLLCHVGNSFGFPEYYSAAVIPYIDWADVYKHSNELREFLLANPDEIEEEARGYIYSKYQKDCNLPLLDEAVYSTKRNSTEQTCINNKNWCPKYTL